MLFILKNELRHAIKGLGCLLVCLLKKVNKGLLYLFLRLSDTSFTISTNTSNTIFTIVNTVVCTIVENENRVRSLSTERMIVVTTFSLCFNFADRKISGTTRMNNLVYKFLLTILLCRPSRHTKWPAFVRKVPTSGCGERGPSQRY